MWGIINTKEKTKTTFRDREEAIDYYNKNCQDGKNCWGIMIDRPAEFWGK